MSRVLLIGVLLLGSTSHAFAQEETWKGKQVIMKGGRVDFFQEVAGAQVLLGQLRHVVYKALDDKDGKLLVRQGGVEGWTAKEGAIPVDQALEYFNQQIQQFPQSSFFFGRRAEVHRSRGEHDKAIDDLDEAVKLTPQEPAYYNNRALCWSAKKDYDKAILDYNEALRLKPDSPLSLRNRGHAWVGKKEFDKAMADFAEAMQLDPRDPGNHHGMGRALAGKKQYAAALQAWERATQIDPTSAAGFNSQAWLLATCTDAKFRDGKKAVDLARKACELTEWKDPGVIDTLAAAHAEAGQFAEAVRYQEQALKDEKFARSQEAQMRLKLFREMKVYRED